MKLSFSTRGWPGLSWQDMIDTAEEMEFDGIEIYHVSANNDLTDKGGPFHMYSVASSYRTLCEKKLTIPCFDSAADIAEADDEALDAIRAEMKLAADMRSPYVAVWASCGAADGTSAGDDTSDTSADGEEAGTEADEALTKRIASAEANLKKLIPAADDLGVTILIKTCGLFSSTKQLRDLLDRFACDQIAVLWDVHHPYRDFDESPAETITNLGAYVKHVHMRDSSSSDQFELIGEGDFPVDEVMRALESVDYAGYVSLEWKPAWLEELQDLDIILPYYVNYMSRYNRSRSRENGLYYNHDGTGRYVWKKDELIDLTFSQVLDRMAQEFPDQYCFKYTTLDYTRTYSEFREDVDRFARALVSMGVKPGYKVTVWCTNVPAWYITFWACCRIGAVLVTMNTAYKIHEAEYLLRQSDTHTLVMIDHALDSDYQAIINELCPEIKTSKAGAPLHCKRLPFLRNVITYGFRQDGCLTFEEAMDRAEMVPPEETARMAAQVQPDDVCNMQYTSGTTGFPKGVMLTHYNVVNNGKCIGDRMGLSTADRMMIQVPMFHCFGMVLSMTSSMTHGATMCPMPYFSAKSSLACINQEKITCFNGVPTMFIAMFNHPDYRKTDFSYMRTGIMAGSGCPPELMKRAAQPDEMNMTGIVSVYGQTETAPGNTMSAWTDPLDVRTETVGYDFPHVRCKVIDPETGEEVPAGVNGEFCAKGYNQMKGYYKMPEATNETIDADGWLHSGDLACKDENGNYRITGRLKDMIIRGGENIYPKEIEEFIYTHPAVQDVQVIGVPDEKYGEEALACIILKEGEQVTEEEMHDFIVGRLARHKVPKYIRFVDSFPMNAAGKILKYKMREQFTRELGLSD